MSTRFTQWLSLPLDSPQGPTLHAPIGTNVSPSLAFLGSTPAGGQPVLLQTTGKNLSWI